MSYQVLARKWRPRNFETLVGQEHVVRALRHALDEKRLHHAWLFTGTRGVGKTTLSRILAKCLNCIGPDGRGDITSKPCGVCVPCLEIDAGRFVDYIEMDAASNRGVDEMAQLLEQAIYAPSNARFKVYMIDEVHMLTSHAFNAMLKTLEEPPEHVKFILATTDPQKIPVTVLSRCLQFNLKQMPVSDIVGHLADVLGQEGIGFERGALSLLGRAAAGSMRDALSLTDQAIAYGAGQVGESAIRDMLGALDQTYLLRILDALADGDGPLLMTVVDEIAARSLSFASALQELGGLLHRIAVIQTVGSRTSGPATDDHAEDAEDADLAHLEAVAARLSHEDVQLYYQIAAHGRRDLPLAPDEATGFSMTLLRMLAFRIDDGAGQAAMSPPRDAAAARVPIPTAALAPPVAAQSPPSRPAATIVPTDPRPRPDAAVPDAGRADVGRRSIDPSPATPSLASASLVAAVSVAPVASSIASSIASRVTSSVASPIASPIASPPSSPIVPSTSPPAGASMSLSIDDWVATVGQLKLTGLTREVVQQTELIAHDDRSITLRVPIKSLLAGATLDKFKAALAQHFGRPVAVTIEIGAVKGVTVATVRNDERAARQAGAQALIDADPFVQAVVRDFGGAMIVPGSVKPV